VSLHTLATAVLISHLAVVMWIDIRHKIIPNMLNASLASCGLIAATVVLHRPLFETLIQAATVYISFLLIAETYKYIRGQSGLGGGDIKFLAAATCWLGIIAMPWVILIASLSGLTLVIGTQFLAAQKFDVTQCIAFGPHLASGVLATWLLHDTLLTLGY
jgi:leader peptidase (prepilin peptidase) / N-methyltransferase